VACTIISADGISRLKLKPEVEAGLDISQSEVLAKSY